MQDEGEDREWERMAKRERGWERKSLVLLRVVPRDQLPTMPDKIELKKKHLYDYIMVMVVDNRLKSFIKL